MAASNVNVVVITGNLTRDPELRHTGGGTAVCELRVAVNSRRKDGQTGEWVDKPNYFDVTVWGAQGENCANYLAKGRPVAIEGRLDWREWEAKDGSGKRQAVQIVANSVQFLGSRDGSGGGGKGGGNGGGGFTPDQRRPRRHLRLRRRRGRRRRRRRRLRRRHPVLACGRGAIAAPGLICSIRARWPEQERLLQTTSAAAVAAAPTARGRASTRGSTPRSSTTRT